MLVATAFSWALGTVFVVAGLTKARHVFFLRTALVRIAIPQVLRLPLERAAPFVPVFEFLLGALLMSGIAPLICSCLTVFALTLFTAYLLIANRGHKATCFCFGTSVDRPKWVLLTRNLFLIACNTVVLVVAMRQQSVVRYSRNASLPLAVASMMWSSAIALLGVTSLVLLLVWLLQQADLPSVPASQGNRR